MNHGIVAIALTPAERDLLAEALRAHRTEQLRMKAAVLEMLAGAVPEHFLSELRQKEKSAA